MEFLWKWWKNTKKQFLLFTIIFECMTRISDHILHFEGPGKRYLSKNPYYQQHSVGKEGGNAPESRVKYQNLFSCFTIIFEGLNKISGHIFHFETKRRYLTENPYYQQLYREKKAGNAAESGVIYFVDSFALGFE